jgi:hypothetical protein
MHGFASRLASLREQFLFLLKDKAGKNSPAVSVHLDGIHHKIRGETGWQSGVGFRGRSVASDTFRSTRIGESPAATL